MKPTIGLTLDYQISKGYSNFPWYAIRENYFTSIEKSGGIPIGLPYCNDDITNYLKIIDGLVITGGNFDIHPNLFGEKITYKDINLKKERTAFELTLTKKAIDLNVPTLGICGGLQIINVVSGGTLIQHIPDEIKNPLIHEKNNPPTKSSHQVKITKNSQLYKLIQSENIDVNSSHHQSIKSPGDGLLINALAPDGVIEGIEHINKDFCIGIQWHPEFLINSADYKILNQFIIASNDNKNRKKNS